MTDPLASSLFREGALGPGSCPAHRFDPPAVDWSGGARLGGDGSLLWFRGRGDGTKGVYVADLNRDRVDRVGPAHLWPAATAGESAYLAGDRTLYRAASGPALEPVGQVATPGAGRVVDGPMIAADGDRVLTVVETDGDRRLVAWRRGEVTTWLDDWAVAAFAPNPTDATLALVVGPSGASRGRRAWLCRAGLGARPIHDALPDAHRSHRWAADGTGLWYVAPGSGVERLDLAGWTRDTAWAVDARDVAVSRDGGLLAATVADAPAGEPERTLRVHARTDAERNARSAGATVSTAATGPLRFVPSLGGLLVGTAEGLWVVPERSLGDRAREERDGP